MRAGGTIALALALLVSIPARAVEGDKRAAAQHFRAGSALYAQERYVEALEEFDAGYATYPLPGFQVNIGQCYRKLDRLDDAAAAFSRFLDSGVGDRKLREEVNEALSEVKSELDRRAELDGRRRRDQAEERRTLLASIDTSRASQAVPSPAEPAADAPPPRREVPAAALAPLPPVIERAPAESAKSKRTRWWVWTIVGVAAAGAVTAGVTVGVLEGQAPPPRAGSLGLLDGRR
jgi:tetratricopeptide (TPR) repeat protein